MRYQDMTARTVIYEIRETEYSTPRRGVLLSAGPYESRREEGWDRIEVTTYRPSTDRSHYRRGGYRRGGYHVSAKGMLLLSGSVSDEELLRVAAELPEPIDGVAPDLPAGMRFEILRSQAVRRTWADHLAAEEADRLAREEHRAHQRKHAMAERADRSAVFELLDGYGLNELGRSTFVHTEGHYGEASTRVAALAWGDLLDLLGELAAAAAVPGRYRHPVGAAAEDAEAETARGTD